MVLPSRKVFSLLVLTTALVASIIIVFGRETSSRAISFTNNLIAGEKFSMPEKSDWEAELNQIAKPINISDAATEDQTVTDTVSTTILSNYLALKQNDELTQESAQILIDQATSYIEQRIQTRTQLTDLNIIYSNNQSISIYGEQVGLILKRNKPKKFIDEISVIENIVNNTNNVSAANDLLMVITSYRSVVTEMKNLPIPKILAKTHLEMINGLEGVVHGLEEIDNILNDPLSGIQGIKIYQLGGTLFVQSLKTTIEFIRQNEPNYEQGSGGYYLFYGI